MDLQLNANVIIVGAGPAGGYLGWKLAASGCKVILLEAQSLLTLGEHIDVIHMDQVRFDEFEIPHPASPELLHRVPSTKVWAVDGREFFETHYPWYVVSLPIYLQRLHGYFRQAGGLIYDQAEVDEVLVEDDFVKGVRGRINGKPFTARAEIVVDASGIAGAVRTRLPGHFGVETIAVPPEQTFFCALELYDQVPAGNPTGNNTFLGEPGFWNMSHDDGVVLGIIAPGSAADAWQAHRLWREAFHPNPGRLIAKKIGRAPYRRPPASLVANGFLGVGDSVYQNKAFSGEGITSGYTGGKIAKEVILKALEKGDFSQKGLWEYNLRYFHGQGAKFAGVMVFMSVLNGLPKNDVDFLFRNRILYSAEDQEYLNQNYEFNLPPDRWAELCTLLEKGTAAGKFSAESLQSLKVIYEYSRQMKAHYLAYPDSPQGISAWSQTTASLWGY